VIRKSQFIDPNTQGQSIFVLLKNQKSPTLLAGEYYNAEFPGHPVEGVMEVPRNIVFNTNEVFVIVESRLEKRKINIIKENEKTLIFNGLEEGEILVMQPLINVLEGTLVERLEEGQPVPGQKRTARVNPDQEQPGQERPGPERHRQDTSTLGARGAAKPGRNN
jgi:hypothetical protein